MHGSGGCSGSLEFTSFTSVNTANHPYFYCVEHGVIFGEWDAGATLTVAEAQKYGSIEQQGVKKYWPTVRCGCKNFEHNGEKTHPYLKCVGQHDSLISVGNIDTAYCISYPPNGVWTLPKQEAVWCTPYGGGNGSPNSIYREAVKFKEFFKKITSEPGSISKPDIDVKDETDYNKVTVEGNYNAQTLTIGPYSIDYIYGYYKEVGVAFGGISDMYCIGYNSKGNVVKERIDIKRYIDDKKIGHDLKYFKPNEVDNSFVDRKEQVYPKGKSQGESEFYVTIDNPNAGLAGDADEDLFVASLKLHIEFEWMSVTKGLVCRKQGWGYTVNWDHKDIYHSHCWSNGNGGMSCSGCHNCNSWSWLEWTDLQAHIEVMEAQRTLFKTEIELPADGNGGGGGGPGPHGFPITMDLAGKVWEDIPEGKESLTDGKYTEADRVIPNVKVTLFTEDGKVATLSSKEGDIMSRINPTYTDENGDYLFRGMDPLRKYYVQFEYNGQVYLPTDYNFNLADYNKQPWEITSKGTEKPSERDSYDKTYSEIGSAPANYKVPEDSLEIAPLTNGYNQSFSQYDLMGFEMTENGDYIEKNRLVDSFFTIEGGEIKQTDTIQEGRISKEIKEFIKANQKTPTDSDLVEIYKKIAGGDKELLQKLQFIEDCKILSYTKEMNSEGIISGSNTGGNTEHNATINRTKLLEAVNNKMKEIKIVYGITVLTAEGEWNGKATHEFDGGIQKDDKIPSANQNNIDEVIQKYQAILENMIKNDLRTNYINNYKIEDENYNLAYYLENYILDNSQLAWQELGLDNMTLEGLGIRPTVVIKKTGTAVNKDELYDTFDFYNDPEIVIKDTVSTSPSNRREYNLYPVYDNFVINKTIDMKYETAAEARSYSYDLTEKTLDGVTYKPIYPGQFYVNQGLWRRQETDLALRKDALYAATRINGKTEVYEYNKRDSYTEEERAELLRLRKVYEENGRKPEDYQAYLQYKAEIESNDNYWQIQLRMRDYHDYYGTIYTKELYQADYNYRSNLTNGAGEDKELELYITYKVTVRNDSQSILDEVTEIVDFYDKDYTYRDDLSWVMYKTNSDSTILESAKEIAFTETEYYNIIHNQTLPNATDRFRETKSSSNSQYESRSSEVRSDMTGDYNDVYISGLAGKKLISNEEAYVYLTFQVNSDDKGPVILDEDDSLKYNYAEINGYKTYYKDGTQLPNGVSKGSQDVAGIIDINSTPGNLCKDDLQGEKYEKNFENDTDRAKGIKVTIDEEFIRSINGTVWEDERTKEVSGSYIGDGVRTEEIGVQGATVELVEKLERGGEYVWQRTTTDGDGHYEFKTDEDLGIFIIPGNYIVRFHYGDTTATVQTNENGGANVTSYNGQDFKSTVYQKDMNGEELAKVDDKYYDIRASDAFGKDLSDAKDLYTKKTEAVIDRLEGNILDPEKSFLGREDVINYSNDKVTNHKAEVMASPYEAPEDTKLINELIENTNMTAETAIIVLEGEYNRTGTDGDKTESNNVDENDFLFGNDKNGGYTLNNIDLGITERPKAGLELGKKVSNVKVTLANGNVLFDAVKSMNDLSWMAGSPYELDEVGLRDKNNKYQEFYKDNNRYSYRTEAGKAKYSVNSLVASKYDSSGNNGLIQVIMDEELMHGATITISYELTVTNVGEKDFEGQDFYYKGTNANDVVTTAADVVLDYVANNLQFREADNTDQNGWKAVNNVITTTGINQRLAQSVAKYNTVIQTSKLNKALTPKEKGSQEGNCSTTAGLVLTQLITPENSDDDKTYNNIAEITTITNTVGRRMAYSVQGNQDPLKNPAEVDSVKSEQVVILPPFGSGNWIIYVALTAGVLAILTAGIILIKKKILKN